MTSSGTYDFAPSNGELVLSAYERIQIRAPALRQEHMLSARREVNYMFGEWANRGVNLWEVLRTQTTLTAGTASYSISGKTIMILDASVVLNFGQADESRRYITPISRTQYLSFANQQTQGPPTSYWFDRLISPTITFWPVPDSNGPYTFDYFSCTQIQDANLASGETPDVPYRWFDPIVAGMSHRLARIYAPPLEQQREKDAEKAWGFAAMQDTENVPVSFAPAIGGYYR
jgi:endonuclease YncB( thermonuclease family)